MWHAIVRVGQGPRVQIPVLRVVIEVALYDCLKGAVVPFHLTVRLWMISRGKLVFHVKNGAHRSKELRVETSAVVGKQIFRRSVDQRPFVSKRACYCLGGYVLDRYRLGQFRIPVRYHQEVLVTS